MTGARRRGRGWLALGVWAVTLTGCVHVFGEPPPEGPQPQAHTWRAVSPAPITVGPLPDQTHLRARVRLIDEEGALLPLGGLHLLHPDGAAWGEHPADCHDKNPAPAWSSPADWDDPHLERTRDGWAVRLVRIDRELGLFRIGVDRTAGAGRVRAILEVELAGRLVWSAERILGHGQSFWDAAAVGWWHGRLVLLPLDRVLGKSGAWPDPDTPLEGGQPCLPHDGPQCVAPNVCRQGKADGVWRCSPA